MDQPTSNFAIWITAVCGVLLQLISLWREGRNRRWMKEDSADRDRLGADREMRIKKKIIEATNLVNTATVDAVDAATTPPKNPPDGH